MNTSEYSKNHLPSDHSNTSLKLDNFGYYQTSNNPYPSISSSDHKKSIRGNKKGFGINKRRITSQKETNRRISSEGKNSLSASTSMIYKNSFYHSNQNHRREMLGRKESNHSYSSYLNNQRSAKRRKIKSKEQRGLQIKIKKLNSKNYLYFGVFDNNFSHE